MKLTTLSQTTVVDPTDLRVDRVRCTLAPTFRTLRGGALPIDSSTVAGRRAYASDVAGFRGGAVSIDGSTLAGDSARSGILMV